MKTNKTRSTFWRDKSGWLLMDRYSTPLYTERTIFEKNKAQILDKGDGENDCNAGDSMYRTWLSLWASHFFSLVFFTGEFSERVLSGDYERYPGYKKKMSRDAFVPFLGMLSKRISKTLDEFPDTHEAKTAQNLKDSLKLQFTWKLFVPSKHGRGALQTPDFYVWVQAMLRDSVWWAGIYVLIDMFVFPVMQLWNAIVRAYYGVYFRDDVFDTLNEEVMINEAKAGKLLYPSYAQFLNCWMYYMLPDCWLKTLWGPIKASLIHRTNFFHKAMVCNYGNDKRLNLERIHHEHIPTTNELTSYKDMTKKIEVIDEKAMVNGYDYMLSLKIAIAQNNWKIKTFKDLIPWLA